MQLSPPTPYRSDLLVDVHRANDIDRFSFARPIEKGGTLHVRDPGRFIAFKSNAPLGPATEVPMIHRTRVRFQVGFSLALGVAFLLPKPINADTSNDRRCNAATDAADYVGQSIYCEHAAEDWSELAEGGLSAHARSEGKFMEGTSLMVAAQANHFLGNAFKARTQLNAALRIWEECAAMKSPGVWQKCASSHDDLFNLMRKFQ